MNRICSYCGISKDKDLFLTKLAQICNPCKDAFKRCIRCKKVYPIDGIIQRNCKTCYMTCTSCKTLYATKDAFHAYSAPRDRKFSQCKICVNKMHLAWQSGPGKQKHMKSIIRWNLANKEKVLKARRNKYYRLRDQEILQRRQERFFKVEQKIISMLPITKETHEKAWKLRMQLVRLELDIVKMTYRLKRLGKTPLPAKGQKEHDDYHRDHKPVSQYLMLGSRDSVEG